MLRVCGHFTQPVTEVKEETLSERGGRFGNLSNTRTTGGLWCLHNSPVPSALPYFRTISASSPWKGKMRECTRWEGC